MQRFIHMHSGLWIQTALCEQRLPARQRRAGEKGTAQRCRGDGDGRPIPPPHAAEARREVPAGRRRALHICDWHEVPPFNADAMAQGLPVEALRERLRAAGAVVIATPGYHFNLPRMLKNALDWDSRGEGLAGRPRQGGSSPPSSHRFLGLCDVN